MCSVALIIVARGVWELNMKEHEVMSPIDVLIDSWGLLTLTDKNGYEE